MRVNKSLQNLHYNSVQFIRMELISKSRNETNERLSNFMFWRLETKGCEESVILRKSDREENDKEAISLHQVQYSIVEQ